MTASPPSESTSRASHSSPPARIRTRSAPGRFGQFGDLLHRVVLGDPAGAAGQGQRDRRDLRIRVEDPFRDLRIDPQGGLRRFVQQPDLLDPVDPEVPDRPGQVAVRLQVGVAVGDQQPQRIDGPFGDGVPGRRVVADPDPPGLVERLPDQRPAPAPGRPGPPGPRRCPYAARPPTFSSLASAECTACASTRPGSLGQRPQGHRQREGLVGGQPDRPFDAGVEGDRDGAAVVVEHHVDQVVRVVTRAARRPSAGRGRRRPAPR